LEQIANRSVYSSYRRPNDGAVLPKSPKEEDLTLLATVFLTWLLTATEPITFTGEVTYYAAPKNPGASSLMKKVWNWRVWKGHVPECPECVDAVALIDPEHIGEKVWLRHPNGEVVGPLMVVDCAEKKHRDNLRKRGWVADISWELARRWDMSGPLEGVTVYFEPPPEAQARR
jgi:hypothetical protein